MRHPSFSMSLSIPYLRQKMQPWLTSHTIHKLFHFESTKILHRHMENRNGSLIEYTRRRGSVMQLGANVREPALISTHKRPCICKNESSLFSTFAKVTTGHYFFFLVPLTSQLLFFNISWLSNWECVRERERKEMWLKEGMEVSLCFFLFAFPSIHTSWMKARKWVILTLVLVVRKTWEISVVIEE